MSKLTIIAVDEIRETLPAFVTAIWELLMDVSGAAGGGTDILVATAITVRRRPIQGWGGGVGGRGGV